MPFLKEFFGFLWERARFWVWPTVISLLLIGGLIVLAQGSAVIPLVYNFF